MSPLPALASAAVACIDAAQAERIEDAGTSIRDLLDVAMSAVAPLE